MLWHDAIQQLPRAETLQAWCQRDTTLTTGLGWVYFPLVLPEPFLCLRPQGLPPSHLLFSLLLRFQLLPKTPAPFLAGSVPGSAPQCCPQTFISTQLCQLLLAWIPVGIPWLCWQMLLCGFPWVGPIFLFPPDATYQKWEGFIHWGCS